jgi:hypothetical protein
MRNKKNLQISLIILAAFILCILVYMVFQNRISAF